MGVSLVHVNQLINWKNEWEKQDGYGYGDGDGDGSDLLLKTQRLN